ncbi:ThuA domain-containing protein [Halogeometricum sp. S1BR25-6]|uniref:ThuA domain-containing protein n=1 Tax=Halogeometricum salsisoli TaxID=2950536 RepID=A0ABU2GJY9_9EURY|nr:ThuA domain-containing protein [Halogeometricum sp. S1BR25-6]MDS0300604.1 ThuA domain-containing protein [Halogeometricum sp. S1BR25-6]
METPTALVLGETTFPFHDLAEMGPHVESALGDAADATRSTDRDDLLDLSEYDLVVDYLTDSELTDDQLAGLLGFVRDGGGYLGLHCAADLTSVHAGGGELEHREEPFPELRELVGGHFLTHPEQSEFGVDVVAEHPVVDGVEDFRVFDEPYQVEADDDVTVLARMDHPDLESYPVVWVREYGDGRVCYASLGHTAEAFENEAYRRLLRNAVGWLVRD